MEVSDPRAAWREVAGGVEFPVRVRPRAPADAVGGAHDGALVVAVMAPPVEGEANAAVVRAVARALHLRASAVTLVAGARGRDKRLRVAGVNLAVVRALADRTS